jgi:hypothetical protein
MSTDSTRRLPRGWPASTSGSGAGELIASPIPGHGAAPTRAEAAARAAGLRRGGGQGRAAADDPARGLALPRAARLSRPHGLRDLPALRRPGQGGPVAGLGPAPDLGQPHAGELLLHLLRVRRDARGDPQHARAGRDDGVRGGGPRRAAVLHRQPAACPRPPDRRLPGPGARGHPGRGPGRRPVHRLHATAPGPLRHSGSCSSPT